LTCSLFGVTKSTEATTGTSKVAVLRQSEPGAV
jgi:hypothetical protein